MAGRELLVGATVATPSERVLLGADVLTTHGVILGMTGSGKTGMAVVFLEELARRGVPLIICDLKGDLTNLLLTFERLGASDFLPFLPESVGPDRQAAAEATSQRWREGLAQWGLGPETIRELHQNVAWRLLTPGSGLRPVNLLPALEKPSSYDPDTDPDGARASLDGTVSGLLALVYGGSDGVPGRDTTLPDRNHVLLATLLDSAWKNGQSMDLHGLMRQIADPPMSQFGILDTETFYPRKDRGYLVQAFNAVVASPTFATWIRGTPLAIPELIGTSGAPRATILYLAHLADRERFSFLTLLLSSLLSWARSQSGSEGLRTLLYLDEVQGILPPTAMPPTKLPLLTLLKQGRAFGTGVLLATQNPIDLDYKALGNMGLKLVGRLDTENDRKHALQGLDMADQEAEQAVGGLKQRQFLLAGPRVGAPRVITSRWAMSYLRGPLTLAEVKPLLAATPSEAAPPSAARPATAVPLLTGVEQLFAAGQDLRPAVLVEGRVAYRKASPAVAREVIGPWLAPLGPSGIAWDALRVAEMPALDPEPEPGATLGVLPADAAACLRDVAKSFPRELVSRPLTVLWHRTLKLVQEEGEDEAAFKLRCQQAALKSVEAKVAQVQQRHEAKERALEDKLGREQIELARDRQELAARERQKQISVAAGVGDTILSGLGALFGGRRGRLSTAVRRGASTAKQWTDKERMADRARAEVAESEETISALQEDLQRIDDELEQELAQLEQEAERMAAVLEPMSLVPAARDVTVRRVALLWLPPDLLA